VRAAISKPGSVRRYCHRFDQPAAESGFPAHAGIAGVRLPKRLRPKISQIRALSVQRARKKIGKASAGEMEQIVEGLNELIGGGG